MVNHYYSPLPLQKLTLWGLKWWLLVCVFTSPVFSQRLAEKDSLLQLLQTLPDDTNKVNVLNRLCYLCRANDSKNALVYGKRAVTLSEKLDFPKGVALSYFNQGRVYRILGKYNEAILHQEKAYTRWTKLKDSIGLAESLREFGIGYRNTGDFPKSLSYFLKAIKIYEALKNKPGIANTAASIGMLYYKQQKYDQSLSYHKKALKIHKRLNIEKSLAIDYNNLGNVYADSNKPDTALYYYNLYKKIKERLNDRRGVAIALSNIGYVFAKQQKLDKAIVNQGQALVIYKQLDLKKNQTYPLQYLAEAYAAKGDYKNAYQNGKEALTIAKNIKAKHRIIEITLSLSNIYQQAGDYKIALDYFQQYKAFNDSVFNTRKSQQIAEMEAKYKDEKKEQENKYLKNEDIKNKALLQQRNNLIAAITFGALLLIMLAMVLYQSNQRKQRTNQVLLLQKQEIEVKTEEILAQRDMLEQQHKDIRDSINYARKIQTAILPLSEEISSAIPEHFIFYQPRDIVSGDFYWFAMVKNEQTGKTKYVISVSDCTGHGVPGAFMSMIGNDLLNDLVKARQITQPDIILNKLHKGVRKVLNQEVSENTDGMDISLCVIDPNDKTIQYAGANSALVYVKDDERTRIAPDHTSVGGDMPKSQEGFTAHTISYADAPVMCYLYTDGYRDQFGGDRGKKFLRSRMQELIFYISALSMQEQRRQVEETINDWMEAGGFEQMDDMLVAGFRLS
ncbi:tetratricopeptide repeat protein [uncultured Microscilla sp.]|uniref:tetratricopeptide repeat protein n=1 Tax=uncultured Microscilla sp. TaxID=432653 RepID=UPI00260C1906|nr:tetratricopeptide repeat protein [uncultured Microscilla sp.]